MTINKFGGWGTAVPGDPPIPTLTDRIGNSFTELSANVEANNPGPALHGVSDRLEVLIGSVRDNNPMPGLLLAASELGRDGAINQRLESIAAAIRSAFPPPGYPPDTTSSGKRTKRRI